MTQPQLKVRRQIVPPSALALSLSKCSAAVLLWVSIADRLGVNQCSLGPNQGSHHLSTVVLVDHTTVALAATRGVAFDLRPTPGAFIYPCPATSHLSCLACLVLRVWRNVKGKNQCPQLPAQFLRANCCINTTRSSCNVRGPQSSARLANVLAAMSRPSPCAMSAR